ncbi:hypothetical protein GGU10DRAFT_15568 [Lentinula aff. detonsa]|uniref:Uncharacterized protein n=1 Tax=Lentinula aff. detonsa TaxID=2804958 RepID=A0AA38NLT4_9AGAR|nr:hypothetical protein GGU10DRAFT_15568 [Lentinula aff. detonsa]
MRRTLSFNAEGLAPISNDELSSFDPDYTSEDTSDDRSAVFSVHSTLQSRTPKKWLTAWLLHESVAMYYCHVSRVPFTSSKAVEFAHILLPKASANQTVAVVVEFILGMAVRTLCINSSIVYHAMIFSPSSGAAAQGKPCCPLVSSTGGLTEQSIPTACFAHPITTTPASYRNRCG